MYAQERICSDIPKPITAEIQCLILEQMETCGGTEQRQQLDYWQKIQKRCGLPFLNIYRD